ncbi:hypothetical protein [Haloarcula sp. 1CSR25-25]|uniref:hypothetical protein n=1 Tax=Haloarcula sp. 1CSR25-25 TaxID=2862545 RepID=UPI0028945CDA|nr:hypothetical protein [Haloarcula sp. 1CSR25-25]MDT3435486.1 hypothetical protein [Haloarcula sp. 1CSR25-25]
MATANGIAVDQHVSSDSKLHQQPARQVEGANTSLEVDDISDPVSYTNPGVVRGTLRTADGTPVANEQIRIEIENRTRLVETDGNGAFSFQYRPQSARTGTTDVQVRYVPDRSSGRRADITSFTVTVRQVSPTLTLERTPSRLGYGEDLTVTTTVLVDGAGVRSVPVELRIDGTLFKRVVTGPGGTVTTSIRLPAGVLAGNQTISATIPYENRAIAGERSAASLAVASTPVTLSIDTTRENDAITVNGTLSTEDGQVVSGQPVRILVDGVPQGRVPTDGNGRFSARIATDALPGGTSTATVTARYDETGTNLEGAEVSATIDLPGGGATGPTAVPGGPVEGPLSGPEAIISQVRSFLTVPVIFALVTGALLVVLDVTVRRLGLFSDDVPTSGEETVTTERNESSVTETAEREDSQRPTATDVADQQLTETDATTDRMGRAIAAGEYESAVVLAYETLDDQLTETLELQGSTTHWELLERCEDSGLSPDQVESIRFVVEAYDRAAFSADEVARSTAERAVECTRQFSSDHS